MSRGHSSPLTCCDSECSLANNCRIGGYQCDGCGLWFCGEDLTRTDDGRDLCDECLAEREEQEETET